MRYIPRRQGRKRSGRAPKPRSISFHGLLGTVLLSPLPIGAVGRWAWASVAVAVAVLLCLWAVETLRKGAVPRLGLFAPAALCFALAILWAAAQISPGIPESLHHPVWSAARAVLDLPVTGAISVNPAATLDGIVRLATYAGILFLALVHCCDPARARLTVMASATAATLYAVYGLVVFLGGFETVLWFSKTAYLGDLTATFVNRNSFATYCGLGLLCLAALLIQGLHATFRPDLPLRERLRACAGFLSGRGFVCAGSFAAVAVALLLSHSRGGLMASIVGLAVFLAVSAVTRLLPIRRAAILAAFAAAGLLALLATSGNVTMTRLAGSDLEAEPRMEAYERTLAAIADVPYLGTGLGTYRDVFQAYRTPSIEKPFFRAHNTYLENALELGIPAALALTAAVAWLGVVCLRGAMRRRRDVVYPCLGVAATALVGAHALVDFSLQIPAVAAFYFLILGAACAQSRSSRRTEPIRDFAESAGSGGDGRGRAHDRWSPRPLAR